MFLFVLSKYQASLDKQNNQSHDSVLFIYENADVSCHSNSVVNKERFVVKNFASEGKDFRSLEDVMTQCHGKH